MTASRKIIHRISFLGRVHSAQVSLSDETLPQQKHPTNVFARGERITCTPTRKKRRRLLRRANLHSLVLSDFVRPSFWRIFGRVESSKASELVSRRFSTERLRRSLKVKLKKSTARKSKTTVPEESASEFIFGYL